MKPEAGNPRPIHAPGAEAGPTADHAISTRFLDGDELLDLGRDLAADGTTLLYHGRPRGGSMRPFIRSGDRIVVARVEEDAIRIKDVLVFRHAKGNLIAHRLIRVDNMEGRRRYVTRGDAYRREDPPCAYEDVVGKVVRILRGDKEIAVDGWWRRRFVVLWLWLHPLPLLAWTAWRRLRPKPVRIV